MGVMSSSNCEVCPGINSNNCNKYCDVKVGQNIVNFVNNIDTIKTSIGEFVTETDGTYKYAINGTMFDNIKFECPTNLLIPISKLKMAKSDKLVGSSDLTSQQALVQYTKNQNLSKEVTQKALEDLRMFNSKKVIPIVIKPGADIEVEVLGIDDKLKNAPAKVSIAAWELNKDTGELEGYLIVSLKRDRMGLTENKFMLSDYGKTWRIPNFELNLKTDDIRYDIVKRNSLGLINPVEVASGQYRIIVDSSYMYCITNGNISIIGTWVNGAMVENKELMRSLRNTKAYKQIKSYIPFLAMHRKYILPFGMAETNQIRE